MIDDAAVAKLLARARRETDGGLLPSCQLALAHGGKILAQEALGSATTETRYVMFSCTKAVVAVAAWQLIGTGELDIRRRVAEYIPEFASHGKDIVTVEQVMLHTGGSPRAPLGPPAWASRPARLEQFGRWRLDWEPGTRCEYHPTSAHWVLAELIQCLTGEDFRTVVNERIAGPLGLGRLRLGVAPDDQGDIADLVVVGELATPEELQAALGVSELPETEVTDDALLAFNHPGARAVGVPGGGGATNAADVALYYQALLHNTGNLWKPDVLADVTSNVRNHLVDSMLGVPANRNLGLVLAGDDGNAAFRGMGHTVSPGAFGHNGAGGQVAWADPSTGLSFTYLTNGIDDHVSSARAVGAAPSPVWPRSASRAVTLDTMGKVMAGAKDAERTYHAR